MSRTLLIALAAVLLLAAGGAALYRFALPGLSSARPTPPVIEVAVASWLLEHSVPPEAAARANPLKPDEANIAAGASTFQQKCSVCHGFDGGGRTTIGEHVYPRAPSLRQASPALSDGQIFTYISDGIRNTAMPAWDLPEKEIWQIVAFLRHLPPVAAPGSDNGPVLARVADAHYVGSAACESCHQEIYDRWRKTRMANVVRDPREHPDAIIPDFSKPDPALTFTKDDVAFAYGGRGKQRYYTPRVRRREPGEAGHFPPPRGRLLPAAGAMGHHAFPLVALPCAEERRLVGAPLPRRQYAAPDRAALRRLPLGQLRHQDEERHGMECRLRGLSRSGQQPRRRSGADNDHQSGAARLCRGERHLHSLPLTGPPKSQSDRRQILRLAGRISHGRATGRLLGSRVAQGGGIEFHPFPRRDGA